MVLAIHILLVLFKLSLWVFKFITVPYKQLSRFLIYLLISYSYSGIIVAVEYYWNKFLELLISLISWTKSNPVVS